jgi:hypothetical protein
MNSLYEVHWYHNFLRETLGTLRSKSIKRFHKQTAGSKRAAALNTMHFDETDLY